MFSMWWLRDTTYDCTDAGWNTSVYIKKAGSYTIKGQSNNVRVMIESTGVKLYLADGLNLNCGATTYVGSRSAAINIMLDSGEKGGLVSAGIGSIDYLPEKTGTTGNMFFNAGNIKAYGGAEAFGYQGSCAGIGGGYAGHVDGITINGGDIYAMAGYDAAAIGGGCLGKVNNLVINGGSIIADKIENAQGDGRQAAHKVEIGFDGMGDNGKAVTDAVFSEPNFKYGTNDVWTENGGKVYFWMPSVDFELQSLNVNGNKYEGSIKASNTSGTLKMSALEPPNNVIKLSATIKASPKTVKKGKKTTVKVTSNSGAKLKAAASNSKAKSALKKKYVKIKNGKTVKITFTKKAPKGKYKFKVTSPAKGNYKKTVKTVTIKVK